MGLMSQAAADTSNILTNANGWATEATFVANDVDSTTVTINAVCIKHNTKIDHNTGLAINSTVARCTVSEQALIALLYPVRNATGDVAMINHKVTFSDLGDEYTYLVKENWPNEMLGAIVLILAKLKV